MMAYAENTNVPLDQSIAEIIDMVRRAGAHQIGQMQDVGFFVIGFRLADRQMRFTVPLVTTYDGPKTYGNGRAADPAKVIDQRNRQKGRALMLVIKAKLESVTSGVETFEQAFLANIVTANKQTVYERISAGLELEYQEGRVTTLMLEGPRA